MCKITLTFAGVDYWDRVVFKGDNGRFYKTTALAPDDGFTSLSDDEKLMLLKSLHDTDEFEGEPGWPCDLAKFDFADEALRVA